MSTITTSGGLGNQFFQCLALAIVVEKHNLQVTYHNMEKFKHFDIFYEGTLSYPSTVVMNESNFFALLEHPIEQNIMIQRETWFQTKEISNYFYEYLRKESIQQKVMKANPYQEYYNNNQYGFIHIRLKDTAQWNPGINYYLYAIQQIKKCGATQLYIASDDVNHAIIREIIQQYPETIVLDPCAEQFWKELRKDAASTVDVNDFSEYDTIQFGCTCKYIILSHGTFSAMIGLLGYFSNVYYPSYDYSVQWHGDIFSIPTWNKIQKID